MTMNPDKLSQNFHDRLVEFMASDITSWGHEYQIQRYGDCIPYWYATSLKDNILLMAGDYDNDIALIAGASRISVERQSPINVAVYGDCDVFRVDRIYRYANEYHNGFGSQIGLIWVSPTTYFAAMDWLSAKAHKNGSSLKEMVESLV